jgi:hypothetical protein
MITITKAIFLKLKNGRCKKNHHVNMDKPIWTRSMIGTIFFISGVGDYVTNR